MKIWSPNPLPGGQIGPLLRKCHPPSWLNAGDPIFGLKTGTLFNTQTTALIDRIKKDMTGLGRTYWLFDIRAACLVRRVSFSFIIAVTSPRTLMLFTDHYTGNSKCWSFIQPEFKLLANNNRLHCWLKFLITSN